MNILITGVNGFIGRSLAMNLQQQGYKVTGLGRDNDCSIKGITYIKGDVLDRAIIQKAMDGIDVVIHLAGLTAHKDIVDNKYQSLETNFIGTKNVLDAFITSPSAKKFIWSSTGKVYGKIQSLPITEEHPTNPLNVLGQSKLITEQLIRFYANQSKSFVIFRIFNVYGPGQKNNFLIPTILNQIENEAVTLGDIKAKRDYTYIEDVIKAFGLAIEKEVVAGLSIFNICSNLGISAGEIVQAIGQSLNRQINISVNNQLFRTDEMDLEYGSYQKIKLALNWEPRHSLLEGLKKTLQHENL